jgi:predicted Rossmann fold nucleotide-binding protein DprA/Smf involved in DNA uptake
VNVAVVGSRDWPDLERVQLLVRAFVRAFAAKYPDGALVSGGARGVDRTAEQQAARCGLRVYSFRPRERPDGRYEVVLVDGEDFVPYGGGNTYPTWGSAAFARNRMIVQHSSRVVAFNAGSKGTSATVAAARAARVDVHEYVYDGERFVPA